MSVIVKGMEMPDSCYGCYSCPLHDGEFGMCNILKITIDDDIPKECPLVEVVQCKDCKYHEDEEPGMVYCPDQVFGDFYKRQNVVMVQEMIKRVGFLPTTNNIKIRVEYER